MAKITNTMNRWHKVIERIAQVKTSAENDLRTSATITFAGVSRGSAVEKADAALGQLDQHRQLIMAANAAISEVRKALARANVELGVSDALADMETIRKDIDVLNNILAYSSRESADSLVAHLNLRVADASQEVRDRINEQTFTASVMSAAVRDEVRKEAEQLELRKHALADKVSEVNATKITVEIDDVIAKRLGMV